MKFYKKRGIGIFFAFVILLLLSAAALAAPPKSLTLQGKLTNGAGTSQQGTFNFTFRIYDAATGGTNLWEMANYNITTDANGVYDVILGNIDLSFADQYFLGVTVSADNESVPRINLTSSPYSFRSNTSNALSPGNFSIGDRISFRLGQVLDGIANGYLKITGALNVSSGLIVGSGLNLSGGLNVLTGNVGIGTVNPTDALDVAGSVRVRDSFNASSINATNILGDTISFRLGQAIGGLATGYLKITGALNVSSGLIASSGLNLSGGLNVLTGNVGIGTVNPTDALDVAGSVRVRGSFNASSINATNVTAIGMSAVSFPLGWTNLTTFPSACTAGQFVTALDKTITCASPGTTSSAAGGWTNGSDFTITDFSIIVGSATNVLTANITTQRVGIGTVIPYNKLTVIGSVSASGSINATGLNSTGSSYFATNAGSVGIGNTAPVSTLTVSGSVTSFGSLNATSVNATKINVGGAAVPASSFQVSRDGKHYAGDNILISQQRY